MNRKNSIDGRTQQKEGLNRWQNPIDGRTQQMVELSEWKGLNSWYDSQDCRQDSMNRKDSTDGRTQQMVGLNRLQDAIDGSTQQMVELNEQIIRLNRW